MSTTMVAFSVPGPAPPAMSWGAVTEAVAAAAGATGASGAWSAAEAGGASGRPLSTARTLARYWPALLGRYRGSRSVALVTSASTSAGRPGRKCEGRGTSSLTCW